MACIHGSAPSRRRRVALSRAPWLSSGDLLAAGRPRGARSSLHVHRPESRRHRAERGECSGARLVHLRWSSGRRRTARCQARARTRARRLSWRGLGGTTHSRASRRGRRPVRRPDRQHLHRPVFVRPHRAARRRCNGGTLGGQGTPLAIVGAYVLAGELVQAQGDVCAALARYEALMRPYATKGQQGAKNVGPFFAPRTGTGWRFATSSIV